MDIKPASAAKPLSPFIEPRMKPKTYAIIAGKEVPSRRKPGLYDSKDEENRTCRAS
jgi:hypothetical protein